MGDPNLHSMTPFEWTMTDRVAKAPMEFVVKLQCNGDVDREKFTQAILLEVKQHPLLQANAKTGPSHRQSYWRTAPQSAPQVHWIEEEFSPEPGFPEDFVPIDLENEIGLRFYGWTGKTNSANEHRIVMKFVFHHACCDGKGGLDFVQQTLIRYGLLCEKNDPALESDREDVQISDRNTRPGQTLRFLDRLYRSIVVRPKRVACFLFQRPRLLFSDNADSENLDSEQLYRSPPCQCSTTIDQETTKAIGEFAKSHDSTTNLVLARELFHTLKDHLSDRPVVEDISKKNRRFRLMIPFSLRADRHHAVQTANCVSIVYLEATKQWLNQDSEQNPVLLTQLGRQMDFIRRWQMQYSWIESIESYAKFWPLIKIFKRPKKQTDQQNQQKGSAIATSVMTNLGRAFKNQRWADNGGTIKVGMLQVDSVHVAVPCTAMLNTNFSLNFYRDQLTLDIIYLPSLVAREDAQAILDSWARRIAGLV